MIIVDVDAGPRNHIGAVKALAALDRLNIEAERIEALRQLEERLERLEGGADAGTGGHPIADQAT